MKDTFVNEVRKYRMEHTKQFGSDLQRICDNLRDIDLTLKDRLVILKPRKIRWQKNSYKSSVTELNSGDT